MRVVHLGKIILIALLLATPTIPHRGYAQRATATIAIPPVVALQSIGSPTVLSRKWNTIEIAEDLVLASNSDAELYVCPAGDPAPLRNVGVSVLVNATQGAFAQMPPVSGQGIRVAPITRGAQQRVRIVFRFESQTRLRSEDACLTVAYRAGRGGDGLLSTQPLAETRIFAMPVSGQSVGPAVPR